MASCPGFRQDLCGTGYPQISPAIQKESKCSIACKAMVCRSATLTSFFTTLGEIIPRQGTLLMLFKVHWLALPPSYRLPRRYP